MAETELAIVVRARDQLTATLRQMGTTVEELARKVAADFRQAGSATETLSTGVRKTATATTDLGREVAAVIAQVQQLGRADTSQLEVSIRTTRAEIERLRSGAAVELIPGGAVLVAERLEQQVREAEQALASLNRTGNEIDIAARVAQAEQAFERLGDNASLRPLEAEIARAKAELDRMREAATLAGGKLSELDRARLNRLAADVREGESALVRLRAGTDQAREGGVLLGRTFTGVGAAIKSALLPILPILTLAGAAFAAQRSVSEALALEDALSRINAEADLTATELDTLRRGALETARALGLSESKAAPALLAAVTDGARGAAEGLDRFSRSAELAAALGAAVGKAVNLQTSILNAYREQNLSAGRAADITFAIIRDGKTDIDELSGSLDAVLPLSAQLGVSFESLGAIIVTATQKGGGFAQGMQAVRAILGALTDAGPEARAALEGVDFSSYRIRAEGLVPVLQDVSVKLRGNAEAIRAVFPDGRAFGAVLSILKDQGAGLTTALDQLTNSSGAVEQALGRRLRDPVFQLGVLFNRMRSEFAGAFGGAFLGGIERAIEEMGGMERATETVADVARSLGQAFGASIPAIIAGAKDLALVAGDVAKGIAGATEGFQRFATFGLGSVRLVTAGFREFLQILDLGIDSMRALEGLFTNIGQDDLDDVNAALAQVDEGLRRITEGREGANGVELFNQQNIIDTLRAFGDGIEIGIEAKLKAPNVREELEKIQRSLGQRKFEIEATISGKTGFAELKRRLRDAFLEFGADTSDIRASVDKAAAEIAAAFEAAPRKAGEVSQRSADDVRRSLAVVQESIQSSLDYLRLLQNAARTAFAELEGDDLASSLRDFGAEAQIVEGALLKDRTAARALRAELAGLVQTKIGAVQEEIQKVEVELRGAADTARLLGLQGEQAAEATAAIGSDSARIRVLRGELERLQSELAGLQETASRPLALRVDTRPILNLRVALERGLGDTRALLERTFNPVVIERFARVAREQLTERIFDGVRQADPFEDVLRLFRGGIEPSLQRQAQLIDDQVERQRNATDELRESLPFLRAAGLLTEERVALLDMETDRLSKSAELLRRRAVLESAALRRQAIELGINPTLDDNELRQLIEETRDRLEREHLAMRLGVDLDVGDLDRAIAAAQRRLQTRAGKLELRQVQREAIHFGLGIEDRGIEQLQADIADARDKAQAFADRLRGRGVRSEALTLGISLEKSEAQIRTEIAALRVAFASVGLSLPLEIEIDREKSANQLELELDALRARADEFVRANPIEAQILTTTINSGADALAAFVTHAKTGKEALRDFFASMAADAARAAAQLLIVKALLAAFGANAGAAAFIQSTFGAAKGHAFSGDGAVLAFASGGMPRAEVEAARARGEHAGPWRVANVAALALGGSFASQATPATGTGVLASVGGAALFSRPSGAFSEGVRAYAQGGAPAAHAPLWTAPGVVERYASGGSPWIDRIVDRPTLERSERLAGAAIVPLSGGGVATTGGERLPVERRGSELVVVRDVERHALGAEWSRLPQVGARGAISVAAYARGGAPWALFGEAGRESVMRMRRAPDGRPGLQASDGGVLPLTRVEGGRLGVEAFAAGGQPSAAADFSRISLPPVGRSFHPQVGGVPGLERRVRTAFEPYWAGGLPTLSARVPAVPEYALGGLPDLERVLRTTVQPFARGGASNLRRTLLTETLSAATGGVPDEARSIASHVQPFALGGIPDAYRTLGTQVVPFALGGVADVARELTTSVRPFAAGGIPDLARDLRTAVAPFALGGAPDLSRSLRTVVESYSAGGAPDARRTLWTDVRPAYLDAPPVEAHARGWVADRPHISAFALGGTTRRDDAMRASALLPGGASRSSDSSADGSARGNTIVEIRPQISLTVMALDPSTAADVIISNRDAVVKAFISELARSNTLKAILRDDRG